MEIAGVNIAAFVLGWVSFAKEMGLAGKWLTLLAVLLSSMSAALFEALSLDLIPAGAVVWITVVWVGLGGGVALCGWYDLAKRSGTALINAIKQEIASKVQQ